MTLCDAALGYAARGFSVIPCKVAGKAPRCNWKKYQTEKASDDQIREWFADCDEAETAIGIVTGKISGVTVLDLDDLALVPAIKAKGIGSPLASRTGRGLHLIYSYEPRIKTTTGFQGMKSVDIRNDGGYIIAPPSPHSSGKTYKFLNGPPETFELSPPPEWMLTNTREGKGVNQDFIPQTEAPVDLERLQSALGAISADDYTTWVTVGMAIKTSLGESGFELWRDWSSTSPKYQPKEIADKWASFEIDHANPVTVGTVFHFAKQAGWQLPQDEHLTDVGNGQRLVRHFGQDLRFCTETKGWLVFENGHWRPDEDRCIIRLAKKTADIMVQEARELKDDDQRQRLIRHALASENSIRIKAMVDMAATEKDVIVCQKHLDSKPEILGLLDGNVLDLKSGGFRPGTRADLITKHCGTDWGAPECETWIAFLHKVMGGDLPLINYIQRAVGYSLTGLTTEQCFFFLYGTGANGKSTFLNVLQHLMGNYSLVMDPETIMLKNGTTGATPELARLRAARVVVTNEVEEGKRLDENRIKQMTGGDTIVARGLYQAPFEFKPEFKIWMAGNHKPGIRGTDNAIWRRVHLIPFTVTIPKAEQDGNLFSKLKKEMPGILQWAVAGYQDWRKSKLNPPKQVLDAVEEYRDEMDTMGHWLHECCTLGKSLKTASDTLYQSYRSWCQLNGHFPHSQARFGRALGDRGLGKEKQGTVSWVGIGFKKQGLDS